MRLVLPEKLAFLAPHLEHAWIIGDFATNADWSALGVPIVCRPCGVALYRGARAKSTRRPEQLEGFLADLARREISVDRDGLPRFAPKSAAPPQSDEVAPVKRVLKPIACDLCGGPRPAVRRDVKAVVHLLLCATCFALPRRKLGRAPLLEAMGGGSPGALPVACARRRGRNLAAQ